MDGGARPTRVDAVQVDEAEREVGMLGRSGPGGRLKEAMAGGGEHGGRARGGDRANPRRGRPWQPDPCRISPEAEQKEAGGELHGGGAPAGEREFGR